MTSLSLRQKLVNELREKGALHRDEVARTFLTVPRETFVPGHELEDVYSDQAITTKVEAGVPVSSSSQPAMMALMLEQLDVRPGMNVLEIGAGTGYNAALLQELTGAGGTVTSLEIDAEIAAWARERLVSAGYDQVGVMQTDGALGWPSAAPYDRIELTVGAADIAPAWVEQLQPGGILVIPLWFSTSQLCIAFEKQDGRLQSRSVLPCGFTRIRGRLAGVDQIRVLQTGVLIATGDEEPVDDLVRRLIAELPRQEVIEGRGWYGFSTFMAVHDPSMLAISSSDERITGFTDPAFGLVDRSDQSLCLIVYSIDGSGDATIYSYGGDNARRRVGELLNRWRDAGFPNTSDISISAYPVDAPTPLRDDTVDSETAHWRFLFRFAKTDG